MIGQKEALSFFQQRFPFLFYFFLLTFVFIGARIFYLQIFKGEYYRQFSEKNSLRKSRVKGPRGLVFDRNHQLLVDNRLSLNLTITPQFAPDPKHIVEKIAQWGDLDFAELWQRYRKKARRSPKFSPITILENSPWNLVARVASEQGSLGGLDIEPNIKRVYLDEEVGSHLFGYTSEVNRRDIKIAEKKGEKYEPGDIIGRYGLEKAWEKQLRGIDGYEFSVVDALGRKIIDQEQGVLDLFERSTPPSPGKNLVLTIDRDLQIAASNAMGDMNGSVVAIDPRTGEILAMHSQPGFDANILMDDPKYWKEIISNPLNPLRNKAIQDHFPPGSTFKPIPLLAGLEKKIINEKTKFFCHGSLDFGNKTYHCHKKTGHGWVDLYRSLEQSCDVYFYHLAQKISVDAFSEVARWFGMGSKTSIKLNNEVPGLVPTKEWKRKRFGRKWQKGETLTTAIGQSYNLTTPIQLAVAYAAITNGGKLFRPFLVSRVEEQTGEVSKEYTAELLESHAIPERSVDMIKKGLFRVVNKKGGTGYWFVRSDKTQISGKSGTTQVVRLKKEDLFKPCKDLPYKKRHHAWFVGFAPYEKPEIVVAVLGQHACSGSSSAGPVVKKVIEKWFEKKEPLAGRS